MARPPARAPAPALHVALGALAALAAAGCAGARPAPPPSPAAEVSSLAPGWTRRAFVLAGHGRLLLALPPGWSASEAEGGEAGVTAIVLTRPGSAFKVLLSPLWNPPQERGPKGPDYAQLYTDLARRQAAPGAVEGELPLERLEGPGVRGFFFEATDRDLAGKEPGPGEWRHLVQGAAAVGPVLLAFALLDNAPGPQRAQALEVVRTARHVPDGDAAAAPAPAPEEEETLEPLPDAATLPLRVAWPGKGWSVLLDVPGFTVGRRRGPHAPEHNVVAMEPRTEILVTVTFRPAEGAGDATACREASLGRLAGDHPAAGKAARHLRGPAARATWEEEDEDGDRAVHAHAFLHRDGLCAHVHASKIEPSPEEEARLEQILGTVRFGEDL